ncbi:MAG: PAS domain S-box protein, partial [Solirubrobacterales bacterium]
MNTGNKDVRTETRLPGQEADLRWRLEEAEQTLEAIRHGEVDAIIVAGPRGDLVYSLTGAEHAYRVIVETMNEAALTADLEGTILFCNQRFCDLMRTPMHEVVGRKVVDFVAEPQRPALEKAMTEAQAGPVRQHLALRDSAGKAVPVLLSVSLLQTTESVSLCLVASDLTELEESANSIRVLREHEQALQESEERYRRFFMDDLTGDFTATPEGAILECNPAFAEIYGFESPAEAAAMGDVSRFNSEDWMMLMAAVREQGRVRRYEGRHRSFDGRDIYVVANVIGRFNEAGELTGVRGYVFDDTDRKLAEMVLHEANARLEDQRENLLVANEQLLTQQEELQRQAEELRHANLMLKELKEQAEEAAGKMEWLGRIPQEDPNPVFRVSLASRILYRNAAAQELCRVWNCEQAMPQGVRELIVTAQARAGPVTQELTVGDRTYLLNIAPFVADGYINLYVQDITERKNVEEALSRSETLLRTVLDNSPDAVFMKDREGRLVLANPATLAIVGKPAEAAIGKTDAELYDNPADAQAIMENDRRIMNSGRVEAVEECVSDPAGTRTYLSTKAPYRDEEGRIVGLIGVAREITDRKRAEESLRELNATLETKVSQRTAELEFRARQLQKLALELSQAEEQERRRLAEILHDDLQQQLAAVKFHLGIVGSRAKGDFGVQRSITQLDKMLKDAIETSRNLSHELSPAVMYHGDLGEIIEWLANQ